MIGRGLLTVVLVIDKRGLVLTCVGLALLARQVADDTCALFDRFLEGGIAVRGATSPLLRALSLDCPRSHGGVIGG